MRNLLIVVDMQEDFIYGPLGSEAAAAIVDGVECKVREYLEAGNEVIFTLDTHGEDYSDTQEGKLLPVPHCIRNTSGWKLHPRLRKFPGKRFEKPAFGSVEVMAYVAGGKYGAVELIGLCTDICVISNAMLIKAAAPELPVSVDSSCCAGVTKESHENALKAMKMCQIAVR